MKRRRIKRSRVSKVLVRLVPMGMARKCCVKNCDSDGREARFKGLPLHKFPKDAAVRCRWLANKAFDVNFKPTPGHFVCHRHFKRADYEIIKGQKFVLRKGSVPTIFTDYDNHPDPLEMPVKTTSSYPQEDLDLINFEILSMDTTVEAESPLFAAGETPKSDSYGEASISRPASSADSLNPFEASDVMDASSKLGEDNEDILKAVESSIEAMESEIDAPSAEESATDESPLKNIVESPVNLSIIKHDLDGIKTDDTKATENIAECKPKPATRGALKFYPGAKLEAKDFNDKWYSARVVETDWAEREVLIHFDKWSSRFDEWIPMDSSRLRVLQIQPREPRMRDFMVGERILATWADGRKYPAKVNAVLENDRYDVLFDDGYSKIVRSSKMTKIVSATETRTVDGESYIGSKQERRDKKRKHTVMELFQTHPRKRNKSEIEKVVKKEDASVGENAGICQMDSSGTDLDGSALGTYYDSEEVLKGFESPKPKIKTFSKKIKRNVYRNGNDEEEDVGPEWIDGEPQGIETIIFDSNDGAGSRRSIIVADKRLPPIWQKHFIQRRTGSSAGKWDVLFVHEPTAKKFRSRNDIRAFMESQGQFDFDPDMFDFCIHRKKSKSALARAKAEASGEIPKKIKTLLPKAKATPGTSENSLPYPADLSYPIVQNSPSIDDGAVFIGGLRVEMEDNLYKCPIDGCNKNFRKENLLQMHVKHYHPEYSKFLGSTPNVADLAYARTIGESIVDVTPKKSSNNYMDKINKSEKRKVAYNQAPGPSNQQYSSSPLLGNSSADLATHEKLLGLPLRDDLKFEMMSPMSSASFEIDDESGKKAEAACAMSPGALFDLKIREEKTQIGIKTLLPVRPAISATDTSRSKLMDEYFNPDKGKGSRKRHQTDYNFEQPRNKGRPGMQELTDYGDLDESAMDVDGPAALVYRFSRRKSDTKSDENSQSSQLNDSRLEKSDTPKGDAAKRDINNETEEGDGIMMMINGEMVKVEQLRREEIINCTCGFVEEDGLMIQCDLCLCWQHGHCNGIEKEKDVPEKYICYICRHPYRQRPSMKHDHDQEAMKDGKLPSVRNRRKDQNVINQRTAMLKRSYDLVTALLQIQNILHSLRVKINVAQKKDHQKLYLWAKNWEKSEIPPPTTGTVPVMQIVKPEIEEQTDDFIPASDVVVEPETVEIPAVVKDDSDDKSIGSDTELMKILEEDSTDESKGICKAENPENPSSNPILLDALTKNENSENGQSTDVAEEKIEDLEKTNDTGISEETTKIELYPTVQPQEPTMPQQPFIPEPEAPIDPAECRQRLLQHINDFHNNIDSRLNMVEAEVAALEDMDPDDETQSGLTETQTKETLRMLLRDLIVIKKIASLCC